MDISDPADLIALIIILLIGTLYTFRGKLWSLLNSKDSKTVKSEDQGDEFEDDERNIAIRLRDEGKNCVVFFGSQTGTAEGYAKKMARDAGSRFGLKPMVADLDDFDPHHLHTLPQNVLCIFVLATYGEGDPTDNAQGWWDYINKATHDPNSSLTNIRYLSFGLGNKSYENYNAVIKRLDQFLLRSGATRFGGLGLGDDAQNTTEEDFLDWKEEAWATAAQSMDLKERETAYAPTLQIRCLTGPISNSSKVSKGYVSAAIPEKPRSGPFNGSNPYLATMSQSRELFKSEDRNCLHVELSLENSSISYITGDHVGINPINPSCEVDRFLKVFGFIERRDDTISISSTGGQNKLKVPNTTTLDALVRYYLDICGPVSRQLAALLAQFAPNERSQQQLRRLGSDRELFQTQVSSNYLNLAQMCQRIDVDADWSNIPMSLFIEEIGPLKPRFYSISSSPTFQKDILSITAVVESLEAKDRSNTLKGVATNYLLALNRRQNRETTPTRPILLDVDSDKDNGLKIPIHIRRSRFRLPKDPRLPVIMVGPGTGVAPFRAFIQERICQVRNGVKVGPLLLFVGSRRRDEDFLYAEEWKEYKECLGLGLEVITAFSREGPSKVYVQHRLREHAEQVGSLLRQEAHFYVCGDAASMARDVNDTVARILSLTLGNNMKAAKDELLKMRAVGRYQEDVW